jgi:hypothetical protein
MIECKMVTCAEFISLDAYTNTVSLTSLIEEINAPQFPTILSKCIFYFLLTREKGDPNEKSLDLSIQQNGQPTVVRPNLVNFSDKFTTRVIARADGLIIFGPGSLEIMIMDSGRQLAKWIIPINLNAQQQIEFRTPS